MPGSPQGQAHAAYTARKAGAQLVTDEDARLAAAGIQPKAKPRIKVVRRTRRGKRQAAQPGQQVNSSDSGSGISGISGFSSIRPRSDIMPSSSALITDS